VPSAELVRSRAAAALDGLLESGPRKRVQLVRPPEAAIKACSVSGGDTGIACAKAVGAVLAAMPPAKASQLVAAWFEGCEPDGMLSREQLHAAIEKTFFAPCHRHLPAAPLERMWRDVFGRPAGARVAHDQVLGWLLDPVAAAAAVRGATPASNNKHDTANELDRSATASYCALLSDAVGRARQLDYKVASADGAERERLLAAQHQALGRLVEQTRRAKLALTSATLPGDDARRVEALEAEWDLALLGQFS
jgi:hypothetical protein